MPAEVLIAGTGAMACLFGARLAAAGAGVTMLGTWSEALEALRRDGIRLVEADGAERRYPVRVIDRPEDCRDARFALVLVKSWQTERVARQLSISLAEDGLALTLQNGLGNRETLAQALGERRVAQGVTTIGASLIAPGKARAGGDGTVTIGDHNEQLASLADLLRQAGLSVEIVTDTRGLLWGKLMINAAINPLTAILGVPNGALLERPSARRLMVEAAQEAAAVAAALGISLPYPDPAEASLEVARRTSANRSSMLQDVTRRAPTEIDAICGAIVRAGEQAGVPTPVNHALWLMVKAITERRPDG